MGRCCRLSVAGVKGYVGSARGNPRSLAFCSQSSQHVCCKFEFSVSKPVKLKSPLSKVPVKSTAQSLSIRCSCLAICIQFCSVQELPFPFINKNAENPIPFIVLSYRQVKSFSWSSTCHPPQREFEKKKSSCLPIHGDGAQIENRSGAAHDVEGDPNVAKLIAEDPITLQVVGHGEHHHQASDKQIRDG